MTALALKIKISSINNPLTQKHQHNTTNNPTLCNEQQQKNPEGRNTPFGNIVARQ